MNKISKKRNIGLDLIRAGSIFYIVGFWHMLNYTQAIPDYINDITFRSTLIILGTFVCISGYLLGNQNIETNYQSIILFYKKRFLRIYPLYFLAIVLFTIFNLSHPTTSLRASLLLSMVMKPAPPTLWFITMIMVFYLIAPLIIYLCDTKKSLIKLILFSIVSYICLIIYSHYTKRLDLRLIQYSPSFLIGIYISKKNTHINKLLIASLFIISIIISMIKTTSDLTNHAVMTPMILIGSILVIEFTRTTNLEYKRVSKLIVTLSYSSYCMYLFHRPIYITFKKIYFPEAETFQLLYLIFICLPSIILCSYFTQKYYNKSINYLLKK